MSCIESIPGVLVQRYYLNGAWMVKRITCERVTNGIMCKVPDVGALDDMIASRSLTRDAMETPNGKRIVLFNGDEWVGTAMEYAGNAGFILFSKNNEIFKNHEK